MTQIDYITTKQAAQKWHVTANWITILCKNNRIPGAHKPPGSRDWFIPNNSKYPGGSVGRPSKNKPGK